MRKSIASFAAVVVASLCLCGSPAHAQTPVRLLGLATDPAAPSAVCLRQDLTTCTTASCPVGLGAPTQPYAGGTTYDSRNSSVWMTNGTKLGVFDPVTCLPKCSPQQNLVPIIGNAQATGLALNESTNQIYMSDSNNIIYWFEASCPLPLISQCNAPVALGGQIIGGLASSDVNKLLYYSSSYFSPTAPPQNWLLVAPQSAPCQTTCRVPLPSCPGVNLGPIKGLAYDDVKRLLWVTDGLFEMTVSVTITTTGCSAQQVGCCKIPGAERYVGLCLQPSQSTSLGSVCTSPPCPACPSMVHTLTGDPALGNPTFGLTLQNAPPNMPTVMLLSAGLCKAQGVPYPTGCGPVRVALPVGLPLVGTTFGAPPCSGTLTFTIPIPLVPALANIPVSTQFFVVCPSQFVPGSGVTNCLSWMITGG